ncbi:hypothetical protein REPUB_Repub19eG0084900 [Reevesia pubescens]
MLAWNEGFRYVDCQTDAKIVIDLVNSSNSDLQPLGNLIEDIHALKASNWVCNLIHTLREGNFCADLLAKSACYMELDFEMLRTPSSSMDHLLNADRWWVLYPRGFKLD